jgi:zinc protease
VTATSPPPAPAPGGSASYPVEQLRLDNGLRVVVAPDRSAPVVGVAVYYDVGFRSEPEGRTGFAHLFEHLMFQGSENVGKMEHAHLVQGAGGVMNGSTRADYTNYYQVLPTPALELALWLEADRMRSSRITQENLENQIAVVTEEIQVNVLNRPYGGFPWILLPPVAYDTFANAHNGYGAIEELQAATLEDARQFFDRYYAPSNAVLTVAGDVDADAAVELVRRHFDDVPAREAPSRPSFAEPPLAEERRRRLVDKLAPLPAVALGWHAPDPVEEWDALLATVLLDEVLTDGDASRLQRRLVQRDQTVLEVNAYQGLFADPFDSPGPVLHQVVAFHQADAPVERVVAAIDEELARVATDGLEPGELDRVKARLLAQHLRGLDRLLNRTQSFSAFALHPGRPELVNEVGPMLAEVTAEAVQEAAARMRPDARAVLEIEAGGAQ